jgi:hypothetical protein
MEFPDLHEAHPIADFQKLGRQPGHSEHIKGKHGKRGEGDESQPAQPVWTTASTPFQTKIPDRGLGTKRTVQPADSAHLLALVRSLGRSISAP